MFLTKHLWCFCERPNDKTQVKLCTCSPKATFDKFLLFSVVCVHGLLCVKCRQEAVPHTHSAYCIPSACCGGGGGVLGLLCSSVAPPSAVAAAAAELLGFATSVPLCRNLRRSLRAGLSICTNASRAAWVPSRAWACLSWANAWASWERRIICSSSFWPSRCWAICRMWTLVTLCSCKRRAELRAIRLFSSWGLAWPCGGGGEAADEASISTGASTAATTVGAESPTVVVQYSTTPPSSRVW